MAPRMRFAAPLIEGRLVRRYKRFLADVELADGAVVTVHCANPGSMLGLAEPGMRVLLSRSANATRKLPLSWELVEAGGRAGRHQHRPPQPPGRGGACATGRIADLRRLWPRSAARSPMARHRGSTSCSGSHGLPDAYVEVKNVHFSRQPRPRRVPRTRSRHGARGTSTSWPPWSRQAIARRCSISSSGPMRSGFAICRDLDPAYARRLRPRAGRRRRDARLWLPHHGRGNHASIAPIPVTA